jgi:hypothetical protein
MIENIIHISDESLKDACLSLGVHEIMHNIKEENTRLKSLLSTAEQGRIEAEGKVGELESEVSRLSTRDLNASIELCYDDGNNPFAREYLKVVNVGVADNEYVVESELVGQLQQKLASADKSRDRYKAALERISKLSSGDGLALQMIGIANQALEVGE